MTAQELSEKIGCSKVWIFHLKKKFPDRCPRTFDDVDGWKKLLISSRTKSRVPYVRGATQPRTNGQNPDGLNAVQRLTEGRARKVLLEVEALEIELSVTKRETVSKAEVIALFSKIAGVTRAKLMRMRADLVSSLVGLDAVNIDRILGERLDEVLGDFAIPEDFFIPHGLV